MASSPSRSKSHCHARSVSLLSTSHPLIPQISEHLCRLSASETTSSINNSLTSLENLFDCVDDFLQLSHTQQLIGRECHKKLVDGVLDGYLRLLDVCSTSKDVFSQTKQDVQQLLSIIRRRRDISGFGVSGFGGYLASRRKATKVIKKSLKDLKNVKNKHNLLTSENDQESVATFSLLNEVSAVTLTVFESLFLYICGTKAQSKPSGWSLVSKLMHQKNIAFEDAETDRNEFEKVNAALNSLISHKTSNSKDNGHLEDLQVDLGKLELNIQDIEEKLECLFRHLIRTRVSLLNTLN